jgi:hypothetical protein
LGLWQANAGDFIYVFYGTMDKPEELPPKGEFFCKYRDSWMPEVPGMLSHPGQLECERRKVVYVAVCRLTWHADVFHKNEIKT